MWYVVQTISRQEQECLAVCRAKIDPSLYKEMFVPIYIDKMRFQKQWHDVKKVLFPGYFFVDTENIRDVAELCLDEKPSRPVPGWGKLYRYFL